MPADLTHSKGQGELKIYPFVKKNDHIILWKRNERKETMEDAREKHTIGAQRSEEERRMHFDEREKSGAG